MSHVIVPGIYPSEGDVLVKFIRTVEVEDPAYSENQVLATISILEQRKAESIASYDEEIEKNNQMLTMIRSIDRTNNIAE